MRPRVLIVAPSLDILGGQSRIAAWMVNQFRDESSIDIGFLAVNPRLPWPFRKLQRIKYVRTFVTTAAYWANLLIRAPRADVLHIFSASYFSYLQCALPPVVVGRLLGKKTLLNYHSGEADDHLRRWRRTAAPGISLADVVVVPSEYLVDVFARFGIGARMIFNTVDLGRFRFRRRLPLRAAFLSNRLLEPLYNVSCILRSFAIIQRRYPAATLTVAGDGSLRYELKQLASDLGLQNVTFTGAIAFENMPQTYDGADIYLTANNIDNMPVSILESFACGLPVVATRAGGVPYIITNEQTGLLVPLNDHAAMAAAAIRLLEEPRLAERLIDQAYDACKQYSWEEMRLKWLRLYRDLAANKIRR